MTNPPRRDCHGLDVAGRLSLEQLGSGSETSRQATRRPGVTWKRLDDPTDLGSQRPGLTRLQAAAGQGFSQDGGYFRVRIHLVQAGNEATAAMRESSSASRSSSSGPTSAAREASR